MFGYLSDMCAGALGCTGIFDYDNTLFLTSVEVTSI